ncbi:hypothetical protein QJQ45_029560, partial [Haematococcus lacustris]
VRDGCGWPRPVPHNKYYRQSGITEHAKESKVWMAGIKPQHDLLSQVTNYTASLQRYREYADTTLLTWPAMWAELSKRRWSNARFRLSGGKQRTVAKFWAETVKGARVRCNSAATGRPLALAYGAAGFSGSGSIGSKGVPVKQMQREACKHFPGRVVLVHEFRTSRVSSARTNMVQGQAESFSRPAMAASPVISGNLPTILDDDIWPIWSIRTEGLLIEAGLWSVVADGVTPLPTAPAANATQQEQAAYAAELTRSRAESALDRKAKAFIQRHVSNLHIFTVKSADSAQDAWQTLESQFTQASVARQSQLQQQLSLLRMEPGESVARFYARLQQLLTELEACSCDVSESTIVLAILAALPPEYEGIVERLRYDQTSGDLSVSRIKRVLLQKEADLLTKQMQQLSPSSSSLWAYSTPENRGASSSGWQSSRSRSKQPAREQQQTRVQSPDRSTRDASSHANMTCHYCAKHGHIMSECFTFDRDQRNRMRTLFSNPAKSSSPGRKPSPVRSSSPARPASPSRGRTQTPGRAAAHSPSREPTLYTASACSDDDDDGDTQMLQPRLNFNSDLYSPFFIDSGASQHIIKDLQFFHSYTAFAPQQHRRIKLAAEGHSVWAVGSGNVFLSTKRGLWLLGHALYVPDSKQNFILVAAATGDGSSFLFRDDTCLIRCNQFGSMLRVNAHKIKNTYILAAVAMPDGPDIDYESEQLYSIQQSALQPDKRVRLEPLTNVTAPTACSATSNSPQVWHQRLCHASYAALARMQSEGMVKGVPITAAQFRAAPSEPAVCVGCVKGKQRKNVAFADPPPNAAPVTAPLGLIHMDVCGPMHARARDGSLYVATFLDEHTKLSVCVPISSKAEVPDVVKAVIERLETQSGYRCKVIRTDNGTEYVNSRMTAYCSSKGIGDSGSTFSSTSYSISSTSSSKTSSTSYSISSTSSSKTRSTSRSISSTSSSKTSSTSSSQISSTSCSISSSKTSSTSRSTLSSQTCSTTSSTSYSPINDTPTVAEALAGPMADLWIEAMNAELASLHANQTWCLEERPANARVLPTKWVLKVKRDAAGTIEKLKARLVAKGFYQQSGVDVGDVYAPVSKHTTLRTLLAKAAAENMEIHQLDFETAFLNGKLEPGEVIYVQQPEGFEEGSTNTVCRLQKALYGLRQAPRAWHARLCEELLSMGFKASEADPALFTMQLSTGMVYLLVYVDDCLLCTQQGDTAGLAHVKKQLSSAFKLKDLGEARWFLGMQLTRDRAEGTIKLDQHKFIQELVTAYSKSAAHSKPLPMAPAVKLGTADQGLLFGGVSGLQGYSDADYAGDKDTAKSTTGYLFTLNGGAISWSSRLQPTVAMSTAEAEYMAASSAAKEALWLRKLMRDLQLDAHCVHLGCDNQAAIQLLHNPMATSRAKHIDVHHHFVRERISRGEVAFHYCHTSSMLADILTKPLAAVQFNMGKQGWLYPVRSMAKRSRLRGLMCSTSNVIKRRFYDRDVSAALNIARIAAGPGRPRELSSWLGRPAMPNPGRPGQEWVQVRDRGLLRKWQRRHQRQRCTAQASELASAGRMSSCTDQILGRLRDPSLLHAAGLIDGEWTAGLDGGPKFQVFNPANGKLLATLPSMKRDECRAAIAAADVAFAAWSARTAKERAQVLMRWHAQILEHSEDLASVMTLECGKPVGESRAEIASGAGSVEWFAEECKRVTGDVLEPSNRDRRMVVLKQPVGVVGAITPWNFPMSMITRKVAPALAAGCTVVLKPSELTPLTALVLAELAQRAGLPPGCINIVFGDPSAIGQELTSNQAVRKIGFTGSTAVGKALAAAASATVKRVSLELGGNAPLIVFKDADLELAAEGAVKSALRNAGQTCICTNRVHVHTSVYDKFAELVVARVKALRLGDGLEAGVTLGPLVSAAGRDKVAAHVEDAVAKGGRVLTGGSRPAPGSGLDAGTFFEPTVIVDSTIDM